MAHSATVAPVPFLYFTSTSPRAWLPSMKSEAYCAAGTGLWRVTLVVFPTGITIASRLVVDSSKGLEIVILCKELTTLYFDSSSDKDEPTKAPLSVSLWNITVALTGGACAQSKKNPDTGAPASASIETVMELHLAAKEGCHFVEDAPSTAEIGN